MPAKSKYKNMIVHIRKTWGNDAGEVDEHTLYKVRSCGPRMAIIDRINPETLEKTGRRGQTLYLSTREEYDRAMAMPQNQRGWRSFLYHDWAQMFVLKGEAGWDPSQNF